MNQHNLINNNISDNEVNNVSWVIDRTPGHTLQPTIIDIPYDNNNIPVYQLLKNMVRDDRYQSLINNIAQQIMNGRQMQALIRHAYHQNRYFEEQFTEQLISGTIQFNTQNEIDGDFIPFNNHDDFIPFEASIASVVEEIAVAEEEKLCCICYETKEITDISQINCSHKFCGGCLIQHISKNYSNSCCPLCREKITHITFQDQKYKNDLANII